MADYETGGPSKGHAHGGDQTAMPGQANGMLPFGLADPLTTGAPGSSHYGGTTDPTTEPGQAEGEVGAFGGSAPQQTGSPGSQGATTAAEAPANATYTIDSYGWRPRFDATGGSTDTEGAANNYGSNTMPGVAGIGQPTSTGAPNSGGAGTPAPNHNHGAY